MVNTAFKQQYFHPGKPCKKWHYNACISLLNLNLTNTAAAAVIKITNVVDSVKCSVAWLPQAPQCYTLHQSHSSSSVATLSSWTFSDQWSNQRQRLRWLRWRVQSSHITVSRPAAVVPRAAQSWCLQSISTRAQVSGGKCFSTFVVSFYSLHFSQNIFTPGVGMPECNLNNLLWLFAGWGEVFQWPGAGPLKMGLSETCTNLSLPALVGPEQVCRCNNSCIILVDLIYVSTELFVQN